MTRQEKDAAWQRLLPYIQGSVAASADQIKWVLTSYITVAAIMTPRASAASVSC